MIINYQICIFCHFSKLNILHSVYWNELTNSVNQLLGHGWLFKSYQNIQWKKTYNYQVSTAESKSMSSHKLKKYLSSQKSLQIINTVRSEVVTEKSKPLKQRQPITHNKKAYKRHQYGLTQINDRYDSSKDELQRIQDIFRKESKVKIGRSVSKKKLKRYKNMKKGSNQKSDKKIITVNTMFINDKIKDKSRATLKKIQSQTKIIKYKPLFNQKDTNQMRLFESAINLHKPKDSKKQTPLVKTSNKHTECKQKMKNAKRQIGQQSTPSFSLADEIQIMNMAQQGSCGKIFIGKIKKTGEIIAIKKILLDPQSANTEREMIKILRNDFIVEIIGTYTTTEGKSQFLNVMMKCYDSNLSRYIKENESPMNSLQMKIIIYQIFKGLSYLHSIGICHRDIRPQNILIKGYVTVICDFSQAKIIDSHQSNVSYMGMRNYRAPELAFGATTYTTAIDIWSMGCVILQIMNRSPIFNGETSIDHLYQIINYLGTPTLKQVRSMNSEYNLKQFNFPQIKKKDWIEVFPKADKLLLNLINQIMVYSPLSRITAIEALSHQYFQEIRDEATYKHIKSQYHLKDFFHFSQHELKGHKDIKYNLIPLWHSTS